jgi:hypothetical protein
VASVLAVCVRAGNRYVGEAVVTGAYLKRLMRGWHVTIRELSKRLGVSMKRIREVRETGLNDLTTVRDWIQAVTGYDPGPITTRRG